MHERHCKKRNEQAFLSFCCRKSHAIITKSFTYPTAWHRNVRRLSSAVTSNHQQTQIMMGIFMVPLPQPHSVLWRNDCTTVIAVWPLTAVHSSKTWKCMLIQYLALCVYDQIQNRDWQPNNLWSLYYISSFVQLCSPDGDLTCLFVHTLAAAGRNGPLLGVTAKQTKGFTHGAISESLSSLSHTMTTQCFSTV